MNHIAGDRGPNAELLAKKLQSMPAAAEVVSAMRLRHRSGEATPQPRPHAAPSRRSSTSLSFTSYVEPILNKKGKDGYACANCHVTHTLFNATWSTVMNVVDTANPESA